MVANLARFFICPLDFPAPGCSAEGAHELPGCGPDFAGRLFCWLGAINSQVWPLRRVVITPPKYRSGRYEPSSSRRSRQLAQGPLAALETAFQRTARPEWAAPHAPPGSGQSAWKTEDNLPGSHRPEATVRNSPPRKRAIESEFSFLTAVLNAGDPGPDRRLLSHSDEEIDTPSDQAIHRTGNLDLAVLFQAR